MTPPTIRPTDSAAAPNNPVPVWEFRIIRSGKSPMKNPRAINITPANFMSARLRSELNTFCQTAKYRNPKVWAAPSCNLISQSRLAARLWLRSGRMLCLPILHGRCALRSMFGLSHGGRNQTPRGRRAKMFSMGSEGLRVKHSGAYRTRRCLRVAVGPLWCRRWSISGGAKSSRGSCRR